ncbi:inositol monophosphatase 1-like [Lycorma delicatula]|uniref:inositol monophosphatase 1-like n=1 Tax=Lycorma delicatula TaxID=130591 RepID=UPI003F5100D1
MEDGTCNNQHNICPIDVDFCFNAILQIVLQAGKIVTEGFLSTKNIETKTYDWDLVTEYDKRVEKIIIEQISELFPSHKFIGEETTEKDAKLTNEPTWLIDPIDGTTNFVHSNPHSCISVALSVNQILQIGIVYNPMLNQLFTARKGCGALLNGKQIHVSKIQDISNALIGFEISLARAPLIREKFQTRFNTFLYRSHGVRTLGSAALSLCYVAMGAWDAYQVDHLYCWDYSAGALIIKEAGGVVLDTSGDEFKIMNRKILTASTPQLAEQLVKLVRIADESIAKNNNSTNADFHDSQ